MSRAHIEVKSITYDECRAIWFTHLWPGRGDIEHASAMLYAPHSQQYVYDVDNMKFTTDFCGLYCNDQLIGVNSGHPCADGSYRSRGLWVDPTYRGNGYGVILLKATIDLARRLNRRFIWSYPRETSRRTYEAAGFTITSGWTASDTSSSNAYCIKDLLETK